VRGRDGDGDGRGWDADKIEIFTVIKVIFGNFGNFFWKIDF